MGSGDRNVRGICRPYALRQHHDEAGQCSASVAWAGGACCPVDLIVGFVVTAGVSGA